MGNVAQKSEKSIAGAIKINEKEIVDHLTKKFIKDYCRFSFTFAVILSFSEKCKNQDFFL